ncbi:MAG: CHAT domain-containing protein [Nostoc sp. CmiVER01]|uniref:CHAT domain-containing protein n=1 Tax=Nostoc sp. CmiVER01 TaxID=3075384 RepID=UPI002AD545BC|nr:CHAT domain-containing protein [Nostoc sp. CmiVER01]MDZ8123457.1 CHAT domain-containing protein [Nostoc sp. CmiVER01]
MAANPKNTSRLRLEEEVREIDAALQRAKHRDQFVLKQKWAVQPREIIQAMLDIKPQFVHFSGHGTGDAGLAFENETGQVKLVDGEALAGLFSLFADQVKCIVLNGCYSQVQADTISQHINYVIGMNKAIGDKAAIEFSVGFYNAIGAECSVEFAHKIGCKAIQLAGIPEQLTPTLKKKINVEEKDQPLTSDELLSKSNQELNDSDKKLLVDILIRSGQAENCERKALCIKIGIDPAGLNFIDNNSDNTFSTRLINYLHNIDDQEGLCKICKVLEGIFQRSKYLTDLESIKSKLNCI